MQESTKKIEFFDVLQNWKNNSTVFSRFLHVIICVLKLMLTQVKGGFPLIAENYSQTIFSIEIWRQNHGCDYHLTDFF